MREIKGVFGRTTKSFGKGVAYAWDWPNVPGNHYTADDRGKLNRLSQYFSGVAAIGVGGFAALNGFPAVVTITASAAGILGGHYLAGVVNEMRRSRGGQDPRP